jgi:hypothetical protein
LRNCVAKETARRNESRRSQTARARRSSQSQRNFQDPVRFAAEILNRNLWSKQNEILRAIAKPNAKVAVKACQGSGKTFVAACAALWFLTRYNDAKVLTTAPGQQQGKDLLWSEIGVAAAAAEPGLLPKPGVQTLYLSPNNFAR